MQEIVWDANSGLSNVYSSLWKTRPTFWDPLQTFSELMIYCNKRFQTVVIPWPIA